MDTAITINVIANDTDPNSNLDPATTNTICAGCGIPANGTFANNFDGTFSYAPDPGFNGSDSFVYEVCDTDAACDTAIVNITVTLPNDPPVANDDSDSTPEDSATTINVVANDTDPDSNLDPTTANNSLRCMYPAVKRDIANNGDGNFLYTPSQDYQRR